MLPRDPRRLSGLRRTNPLTPLQRQPQMSKSKTILRITQRRLNNRKSSNWRCSLPSLNAFAILLITQYIPGEVERAESQTPWGQPTSQTCETGADQPPRRVHARRSHRFDMIASVGLYVSPSLYVRRYPIRTLPVIRFSGSDER